MTSKIERICFENKELFNELQHLRNSNLLLEKQLKQVNKQNKSLQKSMMNNNLNYNSSTHNEFNEAYEAYSPREREYNVNHSVNYDFNRKNFLGGMFGKGGERDYRESNSLGVGGYENERNLETMNHLKSILNKIDGKLGKDSK